MSQHVYNGIVAPATAPANVGDHYVDTAAGNLYISNGTATAANWVLIAAGGSTVPTAGAGSPEGVVARSPGCTYWDVTNQLFYVKDTGTGNTGWKLFG